MGAMIGAIQEVDFKVLIDTKRFFGHIRRIAARPGEMRKSTTQLAERARICFRRHEQGINLSQIIHT
jgi:hypothetical protein